MKLHAVQYIKDNNKEGLNTKNLTNGSQTICISLLTMIRWEDSNPKTPFKGGEKYLH